MSGDQAFQSARLAALEHDLLEVMSSLLMSASSHMEVCVCVMAALEHDLLEVMSLLLMSASSHMEVCVL